MRYVAQLTHTGRWWVIEKTGKKSRVVAKNLSETEAKAEAARRNGAAL